MGAHDLPPTHPSQVEIWGTIFPDNEWAMESSLLDVRLRFWVPATALSTKRRKRNKLHSRLAIDMVIPLRYRLAGTGDI